MIYQILKVVRVIAYAKLNVCTGDWLRFRVIAPTKAHQASRIKSIVVDQVREDSNA